MNYTLTAAGAVSNEEMQSVEKNLVGTLSSRITEGTIVPAVNTALLPEAGPCRRLSDLISAGCTSPVSVRSVADELSNLRIPKFDSCILAEKVYNLGLATLHVELMWNVAARWSRSNPSTMARSGDFGIGLQELEALAECDLVPDVAENTAVGLTIALKQGSTNVLGAALVDASELFEIAWTFDSAGKHLLDLAGELKPFDFCRRGVVTAQDQFWNIVPFLPGLFENTFGTTPTTEDFAKLLRALKIHNVRFSEAALAIFSAAKAAAATVHWREYSPEPRLSQIDMRRAYQILPGRREGEYTLEMSSNVYNHDLVSKAMAKSPTIFICPAATALTRESIAPLVAPAKPRRFPTSVLVAHLDWCIALTQRHLVPLMVREGLLISVPGGSSR